MNYKHSIIFSILFFSAAVLRAQNYTENKNMVNRYKVYPNSTLDISNKYGKIEILNWEKDSVTIETYLTIQTSSPSRMTKLRNTIDFDFSVTNRYIVAKTIFKSGSNNLVNELKNIAESFVNNGNEVKIDYIVTVPKNINLRLNNKYGDVYADDIEGDIKLVIANGGLKANNLTGNVNVELSFGDGTVNKIDKGHLTLSYADFTLKETGELTLDSKSSKINIENAELLRIQSRHDKFQLGTIKFLSGETDFCNIWINKINDELNLNTKFGNVSVNSIRKDFSFININSELTDISLFFERGSTLLYDITYHKDAFVHLPKEAFKSEEKFVSADNIQKLNYGYIGSAESSSKLKVVALKKASVSIYLK
jgi:hypothetical protein